MVKKPNHWKELFIKLGKHEIDKDTTINFQYLISEGFIQC